MATKKIPIDQASAAELRKYATEVLGMADIKEHMNSQTLRAKIMHVTSADTIQVTVSDREADEPIREPSQPRTAISLEPGNEEGDTDGAPANERYFHVIINVDSGPGGKEPVPLNPNGRNMYVPRGKACWIPEAHFEVLKNATTITYHQENSQGDLIATEAPQFPYSVMGISNIRPPGV
ncbi:MAG: hypothetical protein ACK50Q_18570 [Labrys sp. (in: a-proteobacteria)]